MDLRVAVVIACLQIASGVDVTVVTEFKYFEQGDAESKGYFTERERSMSVWTSIMEETKKDAAEKEAAEMKDDEWKWSSKASSDNPGSLLVDLRLDFNGPQSPAKVPATVVCKIHAAMSTYELSSASIKDVGEHHGYLFVYEKWPSKIQFLAKPLEEDKGFVFAVKVYGRVKPENSKSSLYRPPKVTCFNLVSGARTTVLEDFQYLDDGDEACSHFTKRELTMSEWTSRIEETEKDAAEKKAAEMNDAEWKWSSKASSDNPGSLLVDLRLDFSGSQASDAKAPATVVCKIHSDFRYDLSTAFIKDIGKHHGYLFVYEKWPSIIQFLAKPVEEDKGFVFEVKVYGRVKPEYRECKFYPPTVICVNLDKIQEKVKVNSFCSKE